MPDGAPIDPKWSTRQPGDLMRLQEAERAGRPFLLTRDDRDAQRIFVLPEGATSVTVGRDPSNELVIDWDSGISRTHLKLERVGAVWTARDAPSRNGTKLNGQRMATTVRLEDRDTLNLGGALLMFRDPSESGLRLTSIRVAGPNVDLTARQRAVLMELARPCVGGIGGAPATNEEIARRLFITEDAVKKHLHLMFQKFALTPLGPNQKRARLVAMALERGIVEEAEFG